MRLILIFVLFSIIPLSVFSQFSNTGTKTYVDRILNNTQTDITLEPVSSVKVNTFVGNFALQSGSAKELEESAVTTTELGYVSGVTSGIQSQIDGKQDALPLDTNGDILYYNAGFAKLAIGAQDQFLTVDALGLPIWADLPPAVSTTTKGDLQTYDTAPARLPVGTDGQVLQANSATATGLEWITIVTSPTTTQGDIIFRGASTDDRLPIGSENQLLTVQSGLPVWANAPVSTTLTTKGDIQTHDGTANERLGVGTDGQFLVADSNETTGLKWSDELQGKLNPVTDYEDFTLVANNGLTLGNATVISKMKQIGDELKVYVNIVLGSTSVINGDVRFAMPTGFTIDTTITGGNGTQYVYGDVKLLDSGVSILNASVIGSGNGNNEFIIRHWKDNGAAPSANSIRDNVIGSNEPITWATGDMINFHATFPVNEASSGLNSVVSNRTLRSVRAYKTTTQTLTDNVRTTINYDTEWEDDFNLYNNTTGIFTCPDVGSVWRVGYNIYFQGLDDNSTSIQILTTRDVTNSVNYEHFRNQGMVASATAKNISASAFDFECTSVGQEWAFQGICNEVDSSNCETRASTASDIWHQ